MICAVVDAQNMVVNIIVAELSDQAPEGCVLKEVVDGLDVGIGKPFPAEFAAQVTE